MEKQDLEPQTLGGTAHYLVRGVQESKQYLPDSFIGGVVQYTLYFQSL